MLRTADLKLHYITLHYITLHEYTLENGTPQGSVISPLLFIIMSNDFPTIKDADVDTSLYADDRTVWKNGRNINLL